VNFVVHVIYGLPLLHPSFKTILSPASDVQTCVFNWTLSNRLSHQSNTTTRHSRKSHLNHSAPPDKTVTYYVLPSIKNPRAHTSSSSSLVLPQIN